MIKNIPLLAFAIVLWSITVTVVPVEQQQQAAAIGWEIWHHIIGNPPLAIGFIFAPFAYILVVDFLDNKY